MEFTEIFMHHNRLLRDWLTTRYRALPSLSVIVMKPGPLVGQNPSLRIEIHTRPNCQS